MYKFVAMFAALICVAVPAVAGQHVISGTVRDFEGRPIAGATVELKASSFQTLFSAVSDADGHYALKADDGQYIALTAIRQGDYQKKALEYWAWNVPLHADMSLDIRYHRMEIYGVNVFNVQGAGPGLFVYFRPMSLLRCVGKDLTKDADIAPMPEDLDLTIEVNGKPVQIDSRERVVEQNAGTPAMYGYLVHFTPETLKAEGNLIRIVGKDKKTGDQGEGVVFWGWPDHKK